MKERLADHVARQIAAHIRTAALAEGAHLGAQALADRFQVSRAPVTAALKMLVADGMVEVRANRGFFVAAAAASMTKAVRDQAADAAEGEDPLYSGIVEARLSGALPERVSENELMRRFGVPRARLQRMLGQIAEEGWVERLPGHGWQFRAMLDSALAYEQAYRFRAMLETEALLQPGYRFVPEELERLRREQRQLLEGDIYTLPRTRLFEINIGFHETLVGWSGNRFFLDALKRVNRMRRLIEFRVTADRGRLEQQCREHLSLLDLIDRGDMTLAADFLRGHVAHALVSKIAVVE